MELKHTPTPWQEFEPQTSKLLTIEDFKGNHIASIGHRNSEAVAANAAFIIRAVNSHDALVEALEEAQTYIQCQMTQVMPKGGVLDGRTMSKVIHEALALAKGE